MSGFLQSPPQLANAWESDRVLREALAFHLGDEIFDGVEPELANMGAVATSPAVLALAARAETEPPIHVPYSAWGERIDEIKVSDAYLELGRIGITAGVTALPYEEGPLGEHARVVWAGILALWSPSSALYSCPVAMTDAAARTLLVHGSAADVEVVERLTTRDPARAWTSGQWMTETTGGSDVGRTETVARRDDTGDWRLWGTKWFTSSTTSEVALALARPADAPEGSRGLALFRVHRKTSDGRLNNIVVRRLKDKLGTRALPTAELELDGALAFPVGEPLSGGGLKKMSTMLNLTRIHNAIGSVASLARGLAWARAYARVREVFGRPLYTAPAHRATLTDLATDYAAAVALALRCCELTGHAERAIATADEEALLRGLTPVTKLVTARWAVAGVAEAMEAVGGVGYCEDSTIPALVRNTHVQPIWEGTTNVLALDVLRAARTSRSLDAMLADIDETLNGVASDPVVAEAAATAAASARRLRDDVALLDDDEAAEIWARPLALSLGKTYACARLCLQGAWASRRGDLRTAETAARLAARGLEPVAPPRSFALAMDDEVQPSPLGR